ncbi:hypothetical protein K504DRAFT_357775, partial [Pleomassaria siparia CBS 279.74]
PSSPLSPRMVSLNMPSQSRRQPLPHQRQTSTGTAAQLRLPSLPRFHPANFPSSQSSSVSGTPVTAPNSPQPPLSPRTYQKQYSEAQRQMFTYQRDLVANAARQARGPTAQPTSPRLAPMGSPGAAVTPLELATSEGYLTAGLNKN